MQRNKTFRIFLSSTFRDMYAERDYLREHAFRRLNTELMQKGYQLNVVDLRGSVERNLEEIEKSVFRMCLKWLKECKPRMIGLLGDRYGWVYYTKKLQTSNDAEAIRIRKIVDDIIHESNISNEQLLDKSITHIEISRGMEVMDKDKCFFYLRESLPYWRMGRKETNIYKSDKQRQDILKKELSDIYGKKSPYIKTYHAKWTKKGVPLSELEALDAMVYNDLKASIYKEIDLLQSKLGYNALEDDELFIYASNKCKDSIGQKHDSDFLDFAAYKKHNYSGLLICGKSGSGKTVLMAKLYLELLAQKEKYILLVNFAGLNQPSSTLSGMLLKFIEILQESIGEQKNIKEFSVNYLIRKFKEILCLAARRKDIVILVDALDSISSEHIQFFTWLEEQLPDRVRIIASCQPHTIKNIKSYFSFYDLEPICNDQDSAKHLLINMAASFGKSYDQEILRLATEKVCKNGFPLYAKILNDYLMTMTGSDYLCFAGDNAHLLWMKNEIERMPDNIPSAFDMILSRAYAAYGEDWVKTVCTIIVISRTGMRSNDLHSALKELNVSTDEVKLLELRGYLSGYLRMDLGLGWWKFEFPDLCRHIIDLQAEERLKKIHKAIIYALIDLSDSDLFKRSEYLYHCFKAGLVKEATAFVCNENFRVDSASTVERLAIIEIMNAEGGINWLQKVMKPMQWTPYPSNVFRFLLWEIQGDIRVKYQEQCMKLLEELIPVLHGRAFSRNTRLSPLGRVQENSMCAEAEALLAAEFMEKKDYNSAEPLLKSALDRLDKKMLVQRIKFQGYEYPEEYEGKRQEILMKVQTVWSRYLLQCGNTEEASRLMKTNIEKLQEDYEKSPDDPSLIYGYGNLLIEQGFACLSTDDFENARKNYEKGIQLFQDIAKSGMIVFFKDIESRIFNAYMLRASIEKREKNPTEALPFYKIALEFIEPYRKRDPLNNSFAIFTAVTAKTIAEILLSDNSSRTNMATIREYCEIASDSFAYLNDNLYRTNGSYLFGYAWALTIMGEIDSHESQPDSALENLNKAENFLMRFSTPFEKNHLTELYSHIFSAFILLYSNMGNILKADEYREKMKYVQ